MSLALGLAWRAARNEVLLLAVVRSLAGGLPALTTWLFSKLFSEAAAGRLATTTIAGLLVGLLLSASVGPCAHYLVLRISRACALNGRIEVYGLLARFSTLEHVEGAAQQDEIRVALDAAVQAPVLVLDGVMALAEGAVATVLVSLLIGATAPAILLMVVAMAVPIGVLRVRTAGLRSRAIRASAPFQRRTMFYEQLLTNLDYAKELRTLGLFGVLRERMIGQLSEAQRPVRRADTREVVIQLALALAGALTVIIAIVMLRHAKVSAITIAVVGIPQFVSQLEASLNAVSSLRTSVGMLVAYAEVAERSAAVVAAPGRDLVSLTHEIEFRDVWFRYPDAETWALQGVSFRIRAGSATGIVGRNGAGKSTIAALMCGLYRPALGQILWDGVDLAEVRAESLRSRLNIAFQRPTHYEMSVAENVWLGDTTRQPTSDAIRESLEHVGLLERIDRLPQQHDTMLSKSFSAEAHGGHGSSLSGGEWQRLAIARLHFRSPRDLTILDEPTANLDPISEYEAHANMSSLLRGKTSMTIAHRLRLIAGCDQILVVHDGRVVERGTHEELMAGEGHYRTMFEAQSAAVAIRDAVAHVRGETP